MPWPLVPDDTLLPYRQLGVLHSPVELRGRVSVDGAVRLLFRMPEKLKHKKRNNREDEQSGYITGFHPASPGPHTLSPPAV
jgi:hypothetical protein